MGTRGTRWAVAGLALILSAGGAAVGWSPSREVPGRGHAAAGVVHCRPVFSVDLSKSAHPTWVTVTTRAVNSRTGGHEWPLNLRDPAQVGLAANLLAMPGSSATGCWGD